MDGQENPQETPRQPASTPPKPSRIEWLLWIPAIVAFLIYVPTLNHGILTDDKSLIVENPYLVGLSGLRQLWSDDLWEASGVHMPAQYYRPLVMTSFWLQVLVLGPKLWWLRLGNVLIHSATAALLPRFLLRTHPKLGIPLAVFVTLVWALHPMNTESVIWLSGRFDALVVLLSVSTLFLNLSVRRIIWVPLCLALALLTKEVAITLFPGIILADVIQHGGLRESLKNEGRKWLMSFLVVVFYLALRRALGIYGATDLLLGIAPSVFLSGLADMTLTYARLTFFPLDLDVHHWYTAQSITMGIVVLFAYLAIFVGVLVYSWRTKKGILLATCAMACASIMLASNVGPSQHVFGDRFWSLTGIALVFGLGELLEKRVPLDRIRSAPVIAASAVFGLLTLQRGTEWESEERLTDVALERNPNHPHWLLLSSHHLLQHGMVDEARQTLLRLIEIDPQMAKAHNGLCVVELRRNHLEEAERECKIAARLGPENPLIWTNLASVYINERKYEETREVAEKALSIQPKNVEAEYLLAVAHANLRAFTEARKHVENGLSLAPNHPGLRKLKAQLDQQKPAP